MNLSLIIRIIGSISGLVQAGASFRAFKIKSPGYARIFAVLCILETIADVIQWSQVRRYDVQVMTSNIVVLSELVVYSYIFYLIIYSKVIKWIFIPLNSLILLRCLYLFGRDGFSFKVTMDLQVYADFILLIPAFAYLREIFIFQIKEDVLRDFTFWFVTGTIFYCAATIVYLLGLDYLLLLKVKDTNFDFYLFTGIVFLIVNIIYIKAFSCLRNLR
jgi:hypothetical protein